jgi:hypothetical protein
VTIKKAKIKNNILKISYEVTWNFYHRILETKRRVNNIFKAKGISWRWAIFDRRNI